MRTNLAALDREECVVVPRRVYERLTRLIREAALPPLPEPDERGFYPAVESVRAITAREIIYERLSLELTRDELARLAGVRLSTVKRVESGRDSIGHRAMLKLDAALKRAARSRRMLRRRAQASARAASEAEARVRGCSAWTRRIDGRVLRSIPAHNARDVQPTAPSNDPSWSVIARAAAGDSAARSKFATTCLPVIRSLLELRWRSTPLASDVEDAVQEVFVECLRAGGVLSRADPSRGEISGFLYGVACNVAKRFEENASQRKGQLAGVASAFVDVPAREQNMSVQFDRMWALAMVRAAGELMRTRAEHGSAEDRQRVELLKLRFSGGLPIREIAAQWNVDAEQVHRAYRKAREEFRVCLREVIGEHSLRPAEVRDEDLARILELLD